MENRKILLLFGAVFALACLPFLIIYPSGGASAGLSHGFLDMLTVGLDLVLIAIVGGWAIWIGRDAPIILPLTFVLIYAVAAFIQLDAERYPLVPWFVLGAILVYSLALTLVDTRRFVVAIAVSSSIAFHLGLHSSQDLPQLADPLYFLIGRLLALALIQAMAVCFAVAVMDEVVEFTKRLLGRSDVRVLSMVRSWFLL